MTFEQAGIIATFVEATLSVLWIAYVVVVDITKLKATSADATKMEGRLVRLELMANTLWEFQMRRGAAEAVQRGIGTMSSPLTINAEVMAWCDPIKEELRQFYFQHGAVKTDLDMMIDIEHLWGTFLMEHVCIPHGLHQGACLLIALTVMKDNAVVDVASTDEGRERSVLASDGTTEMKP